MQAGRWTHDHDGGLVVFLIGARVNKPVAVRRWWPVVSAMPRMLRELQQDPALGLLGVTSTVHGRGSLMVQYWRDLESLLAYAHEPEHAHRPAWRAFNRAARDAGGAVGIWHETFVVPAGGYESMYVDMPLVGLPRAVGAVPVTGSQDTARARLARAA
jgi:fumigallin biosynthesis monooxygenase-like protein